MSKKFLIILTLLLIMGCTTAKKEKIQTVFYPTPPQYPKLQFLISITSEENIGKERDSFREFVLGRAERFKAIARPFDIDSTPGKIYISDRTFNKILIVDLDKKEFDYIRDEKGGQLQKPAGLWITPDGKKYIADQERKQIVVFDEENKFLKAYGSEGQFEKPLDVAVYDNRMYVCDFDKNHIAVVDLESGETMHTIGEAGEEEGKFIRPTHITVDQGGYLYVTDSFNFRIQKLDYNGKFEKKFGYQGDTLGGFARPKGIAVDKEGFLYTVDTAFENVQIFDPESALLMLFFGGFGRNPGNMYLPNGIHIDYNNIKYFQEYVDKDFSIKYLVYVANQLGDHKINVYGFGEWIGEPLPGVPRRKIKLD